MKEFNKAEYCDNFMVSYFKEKVFSRTMGELADELDIDISLPCAFAHLANYIGFSYMVALLEDETFLDFPVLGDRETEEGLYVAFAEIGYAYCEHCDRTVPVYLGIHMSEGICRIEKFGGHLLRVFSDEDNITMRDFAEYLQTATDLFNVHSL